MSIRRDCKAGSQFMFGRVLRQHQGYPLFTHDHTTPAPRKATTAQATGPPNPNLTHRVASPIPPTTKKPILALTQLVAATFGPLTRINAPTAQLAPSDCALRSNSSRHQ